MAGEQTQPQVQVQEKKEMPDCEVLNEIIRKQFERFIFFENNF